MSDLSFDALGLVTVGGTALLAAAAVVSRRRLRALPIALCVAALAVMGAAAVTRHRGEGAVALAVLIAAAALVDVASDSRPRTHRAAIAADAVGVVALGVAGFLDADAASMLAVVGAGIVVGVATTTRRLGVVALPATFLVMAEHVAEPLSQSAADRAGVAAAAIGVAVAVVSARVGAPQHATGPRARPGDSVAPAAFGVAYVIVAQSPAELRSAGLLLAGGAVAAVASAHRIGLVALVPGVAAAVEALGVADRPVHAAAGVAMLVIALASWRAGPDRSAATATAASSTVDVVEWIDPRQHWATPLAVIVAVVPTWGWSGADVGVGYNTAVAAAVAAAAIAGIASFGRLRRARPASFSPGTRQ